MPADLGTVFILMDKKITALETQKSNPNRLNVYLDHEFSFGVSRFIGAWLEVGQVITEEKISQLIQQDERERAFQTATKFISYKPRTEFEVRTRLLSNDISELIIEDVIDELIQKKYIDDQDFATQWVEVRCKTKPRSRFLLTRELIRKGIQEELIEKILQKAPQEKVLAYELCEKYNRKFAGCNNEIYKKKISDALLRRGFSYSVTQEVVKELVSSRNLDKEE